MRDTVNILNYWIKELRRVIEFKELAKVEDIEFLRLYGATQRTLDNQFIHLADEYGIERLEKVCGIYPDPAEDLEARRVRLLAYWNDRKPYTEEELQRRLEQLCGSGNFEIFPDYKNFFIKIITSVGGVGVFDEVTKLLDYFLPANIVLELKNEVYEACASYLRLGMALSVVPFYVLTNDINPTYPVSSVIGVGGVVMPVHEEIITNDVNGVYTANMSLSIGSTNGLTTTKEITNDLNSSYSMEETKTLGGAVSATRLITIEEE